MIASAPQYITDSKIVDSTRDIISNESTPRYMKIVASIVVVGIPVILVGFLLGIRQI
jgi:hypothetical protein